LFAFVATLLAAVGIYGIMAYAVEQRTREIGIRMALGAGGREVLRLIVGQAVWMIAAGLALGLAGALALTRFLSSELWEVQSTDPATFAAVSLILIVVALLACLVPTHRAVQVDPSIALRYE
jgi:ABC-type antimicrobial peptide transport system permease subunit